MNYLPEEILLNIFKNLPFVILRRVIPRVCKTWKRLANDSTLYREIYFYYKWCNCSNSEDVQLRKDGTDYFRDGWIHFLAQDFVKPEIFRLAMTKWIGDSCRYPSKYKVFMDSVLINNLHAWQRLTTLHLDNINVSEDAFVTFLSSLNPEVFTQLVISHLTVNFLRPMQAICGRLVNLQKLDILACEGVTDDCLMYLAKNKLTNLSSIKFTIEESDYDYISNILGATDEGLSAVLRAYSSHLRRLEFDFEQLSDERANESLLAETIYSISQCQQLQYLNINHFYSYELMKAVYSLENLQYLRLHLYSTYQKDQNNNFVSEVCLSSLENVHLSWYHPTDEPILALLPSSGSFIKNLDLSGCSCLITVLKCVVKYCSNLQELEITTNNKPKLIDVQWILNYLCDNPTRVLPHLREMTVRSSGWHKSPKSNSPVQVDPKILRRLRRKRPKLALSLKGRLTN